jgi:hypothetical protein
MAEYALRDESLGRLKMGILPVVLVFLVVVGLVSAIVLPFEVLSVIRMSPGYYSTGIAVARGRFRSKMIQGLRVNQADNIAGLRLLKLDQSNGIFRARLSLTRPPTPFLVKGEFNIADDGLVTIVGRLPLSSVVVLGAWAVFWISVSASASSFVFDFLMLGAIGFGTVFLVVAVLWVIEVGRIRQSVGQLKDNGVSTTGARSGEPDDSQP